MGFLKVHKGFIAFQNVSLFFSVDLRFTFVKAVKAVTCLKFSSGWLSSRFIFTMKEQLRKQSVAEKDLVLLEKKV